MKTKTPPKLVAHAGNKFILEGATDTYLVDLSNPAAPSCVSATQNTPCQGFYYTSTCRHIEFAQTLHASKMENGLKW